MLFNVKHTFFKLKTTLDFRPRLKIIQIFEISIFLFVLTIKIDQICINIFI